MDTEQIEIETGSSLFAWLAGLTLVQIEEGGIRASVDRHDGHRPRMIAELGMSKKTLLRRLSQYGLRKQRVYLHGGL